MFRIIEFIKVAFISAFAGAIVSLPVILLRKESVLPALAESAVVGTCIGMIIWLVFYLFYQILKHSRIFSFTVVTLFIGIGTVSGAYILGLRNINHYLIITSLAEVTGLSIAAFGFRNYMKFNDRLKTLQKEYSDIEERK